jgi:hypothetical protein
VLIHKNDDVTFELIPHKLIGLKFHSRGGGGKNQDIWVINNQEITLNVNDEKQYDAHKLVFIWYIYHNIVKGTPNIDPHSYLCKFITNLNPVISGLINYNHFEREDKAYKDLKTRHISSDEYGSSSDTELENKFFKPIFKALGIKESREKGTKEDIYRVVNNVLNENEKDLLLINKNVVQRKELGLNI